MYKSDLRKLYKKKRLLLSTAERNKMEDLMLIRFQQLNIEVLVRVMTYAAMERLHEYNPQLITDYCYFRNPDQLLFYPVVDKEANTIIAALVNDETVFVPNNYGIDEPINAIAMFPEEIDLILIPLLAFDNQGYRVGYGKGYYDRFLSECRNDVLKIGFSFFDPVNEISDINEFDIKLDHCITPDGIYSF